jgi:hypothetical protein
MLWWHKQLWLIDHGASLYFHHSWNDWRAQATKPFGLVKDHVLLPQAADLYAVDAEFRTILTKELIESIVSLIPDEWLEGETAFQSISAHRQAYVWFLETRIAHSEIFVKEAQYARQSII